MNGGGPLAVGGIALLTLAACAGIVDKSYVLEGSDANYDALERATEKCRADGGEVRLRRGYDSRLLSNYECVIGKAR
jgi:hypothetical protein